LKLPARTKSRGYVGPDKKWRELKVIAALTDATLDKLLQDGADMVIEKFKRTRAI
jgi:hypothetical protein